jgi:hypothetical protein
MIFEAGAIAMTAVVVGAATTTMRTVAAGASATMVEIAGAAMTIAAAGLVPTTMRKVSRAHRMTRMTLAAGPARRDKESARRE